MGFRISMLLVFATACAWPSPAGATQYRVRPLPSRYYPVAMNNWGTVVADDGVLAAVLKRRSVTEIPSLAGRQTSPAAINDEGFVVGTAYGDLGVRPFGWTKEDGIRDFGGPLLSICNSGWEADLHPVAVNDSGLVAGLYGDTDCIYRPARWDAAGMHVIPGVDYGRVADVNERGQIVGTKFGPIGSNGLSPWFAFVWQAGKPFRFFRFGHSNTAVDGINDQGVMVGESDSMGTWVLVPGHKPRPLPIVYDARITNRRIYGLTANGAWVSWNTHGRDQRPIRVPKGWTLDALLDANDRGQILFLAERDDGHGIQQGLVATPR